MAALDVAPHFSMNEMSAFHAEDFETASIRSAAPSYISEAPSYHSQATTNNEPIPPYSPPAPSSSSAQHPRTTSAAATLLLPTRYDFAPSPGLPPIPPPAPRRPELPSLGGFRSIPSWSTVTNRNPTARHYHNVASRRVNNQAAHLQGIKRMVLERVEEEERNRVRPLEDPYLVGEEAAARARRERLARENGDEILYREDRRWDFFLGQMRDWDERKQPTRREAEPASRGRLARRITGRA